MKIECLIKRDGGSYVTMPAAGGSSITYHFRPDVAMLDYQTVPHVCEVDNEDHAARFLSEDLPDYRAVPDPASRSAGLTLEPPADETTTPDAPVELNADTDLDTLTDEQYMMLATTLPGLENPRDPNVLALYLHNHYGVVSDPAVGALALIKQIVKRQHAHEAEQ